jgi:metal-sulfur cluster biosynthetic enzyme
MQVDSAGPTDVAQELFRSCANSLLPLWQALADIPDPCQQACGYSLSIVDLGIVNAITARDGVVTVSVTFTEPACLFGFRIINEIEDRLARFPGVEHVAVSVDPYPLWEPSRLTDRARSAHAARRTQFGPNGGASDEVLVAIPKVTPGVSHV